MKKRGIKIVLATLFVVVLLVLVYLNIFYFRDCGSEECFNVQLRECKRGIYVKPGDVVFEYKIFGLSREMCEVSVKVLEIGVSEEEKGKLVGKSMDCLFEKGIVVKPESELQDCHGLLKEELQEIIIDRLHKQIVENLAEIKGV